MRNLNICEFGHIFRLSKLEALDLSFTKFDRIPVIMRQYSESRGFIPNLKFLDCSGTDVTFSILDELLQKHEKLKKIVVAGKIFRIFLLILFLILNCQNKLF